MNCLGATDRLTAYLDGDLDPTLASAVRGHLRSCPACATVAAEHQQLRAALSTLPPVEPPPAMWAGVLARLGDAEVADGRRSGLALWWQRWMPRLVPVAGVAAAGLIALGAKTWIDSRNAEPAAPVAVVAPAPVAPAPVAPAPVAPPAHDTIDVAEELAGDDARADRAYAAAVDDLVALADDARPTWSTSQAQQFTARVAALRGAVAAAPAGVARAHAWQALIDFTQRAVVGVRIAEAR
jgi:anti-sigma factor RsiW